MTDDFGNELQPRRRASDTDWGELCDRVDEMDRRLQVNTEATERIDNNTRELVEAFRDLKGFFSVTNAVGRLAKPLGWVLAAGTAGVLLWDRFKAALAALFRG
jgi:hypothetical protein